LLRKLRRYAYLISRGKAIEYQDVTISASFLSSEADYIITRNKRHHEAIPVLENKIFTPEEFIERVLNEDADKLGPRLDFRSNKQQFELYMVYHHLN